MKRNLLAVQVPVRKDTLRSNDRNRWKRNADRPSRPIWTQPKIGTGSKNFPEVPASNLERATCPPGSMVRQFLYLLGDLRHFLFLTLPPTRFQQNGPPTPVMKYIHEPCRSDSFLHGTAAKYFQVFSQISCQWVDSGHFQLFRKEILNAFEVVNIQIFPQQINPHEKSPSKRVIWIFRYEYLKILTNSCERRRCHFTFRGRGPFGQSANGRFSGPTHWTFVGLCAVSQKRHRSRLAFPDWRRWKVARPH